MLKAVERLLNRFEKDPKVAWYVVKASFRR
jgi:hypothetical protein